MERCRDLGWRNYIVWSQMPEKNLSAPFRKLGCEIILQPRSNGNFDGLSVFRTFNMLKKRQCDIFHCYNDHTSPLLGAALARTPVRIWSKLSMSSYYEEGASPRGLHRFMPSTRVSCLLASKVLAISHEVALEIIKYAGPLRNIDVVYGYVDIKKHLDAKESSIRSEYKCNKSNLLITAVGHAIPVKGWDIAIEAFVDVFKKYKQTRMLLVGAATSSDYFKKLTTLIRQYNLENYVKFTGRREDVPGILKSSDIFILPSRSEGLPSALIEAMAAGLPCVASRVGGIPEVIEHGSNGFLFERENAEELSKYIMQLIEDPTLRSDYASRGSVRARMFSMESYVDHVVTIYKSLLHKDNSSF